ncbi:hypothetical protein HA402_002368 [Bradysia odoriphaga]|nr:hypothetical protein HA402_002368 [Bradysia odoriphaga]
MNITDSQPKDLLWTKSKRRNSVDEFADVAPHKMAKCINGPIFVTLANESPARHYDSEDSTYDSFHARETDECRDTSDTDSYGTDGTDTMEVLEYDVASITASEVFYSNDSSSGTDDYVVAVARAIFDTSSSDMNDLCFLADTEESDGPTDVELGRADYWTCVKCKNRQNNPMYRYCEKCYQIRKTQFPPRPRQRRSRSKLKKRLPASRRPVTSSSDEKEFSSDGVQRSSIKKKRYSRTRTTSKTNSAGETGKSSTADDNEFDDRVKEGQGSSNFIIKNKLFKNVVDVETTSQLKSTQLNLTNAPSAMVQKDSGFSSCFSSQELSSDLVAVKSFDSQETFCSEYEEIVGSKNRGPFDVNTMQESKSFESTASSAITSQSSSLSQASTSSSSTTSSGIRSMSSCSGPNLLYKNVESVPTRVNSKRRAYSDTDEPQSQPPILKQIFGLDAYGPCMICLSQPKDGVFVHSRFLHLCCCYRCAVKIWNKQKRCPICNCKVNNVQKIFVH